MIEEWRSVVGYEGKYEVSNFGRIRTVDRIAKHPAFPTKTRRLPGRVIKQFRYGNNYPKVGLWTNNKRVLVYVHRLVAEAFIGPAQEGYEVAHNDGTRTNNFISNLRYATRSENLADMALHGTKREGEKLHSAKLTGKQVAQIKRLLPLSKNKDVAVMFGVHPTTISDINTGRTWRHI